MTDDRVVWFDNEHPALRRCWHPVAEVDALDGDGPHPVRLLGLDWALFRAAGTWRLLPDECPHRLAPLTAGTLEGDILRCGYHGWCFAGDGTCVEIPATASTHIPPAAHLLPAAAATERYGLVWVAIEDPITPMPEITEWDDPAFGLARLPVQDWEASAAQMTDNFLDVAHFPFTHTSTIGDPDDLVVGDHEIRRQGWVFSAHHRHSARMPDGSGGVTERTMDFECVAPHHVRLRLDYGDGGVFVLLFFHQPVDVGHTRLYCLDLDTAIAADPAVVPDVIDFQQRVAAEDQAMLERLGRKAVALGTGREVHTRADRITVELRHVLADLVAAATTTVDAAATPIGGADLVAAAASPPAVPT